MTVPIQIPIITTSPPTTTSAKPNVRPENAESFEQILKQKTCEGSQFKDGCTQLEQAVSTQTINEIQTEVKPTSEKIDKEIAKKVEAPETEVETSANDVMQVNETAGATLTVPVQAAPTPVVLEAPEGEAVVSAVTETNVEAGQGSSKQITESGTVAYQPETKAASNTTETKTSATAYPTQQAETAARNEAQPKQADAPVQMADLQVPIQDKPVNANPSKAVVEQPAEFQAQPSQEAAKGTTSPVVNNQETAKPQVMTAEAKAAPVQAADETTQAVLKTVETTPVVAQKLEADAKPEVSEKLSEAGKKFTTEGKAPNNSTSADPTEPAAQKVEPKVVNAPTAAESKTEAKVVSYTNEGKPERKADVQAPPETQGKAPPAPPPGVVDERMMTDPTTGKTYEPARLAEAQSTEILRQISRQIAGSSNSGNQTIRIQLHPEDLGQIELKIVSTPQGTNVSLVADQSSTGKLLESHLADLRQTLIDAGVQLSNVNIGHQAPQQSFRNPQYDQTSQRQAFRYENNPAATEESDTNKSQSKVSLVDYLI